MNYRYLLFCCALSAPVYAENVGQKTLDEIAFLGQNDPTHSLLRDAWMNLRIKIWDQAINMTSNQVTAQTQTIMANPAEELLPYEYPYEEIHYRAKPMWEIGWARYDANQNQTGISLNVGVESVTDEQGYPGVAIPANIVIPLKERSMFAEAKSKVAHFLQAHVHLDWKSLGPIPDEITEFYALQKRHIAGRIEEAQPPQKMLEEYAKANAGSYLADLFRYGPFAGSIRYENGKIVYRSFPGHATKDPDLYHRLDCEVVLHYESKKDALVVEKIRIFEDTHSDKMIDVTPGHRLFLLAQRIVGANLSNFTTIREHLGITHLKIAQVLADALKRLPDRHPMKYFLHRFAYRTDLVNSGVDLLIGDDSSQVPIVKSYSSNVLKRMLTDLQFSFNIRESDPRTHAVDCGFYETYLNFVSGEQAYAPKFILDPIAQKYVLMPYETLEQSIELFEIFLYAAREAIESLNDRDFESMRVIYNCAVHAISGVEDYAEFSDEGMAKLLAIFMHNATVRHELKGGLAWNVTSFLPGFPTTINRANRGGLPNYEDMLNADYITIATKGELPKLSFNLTHAKEIFAPMNDPELRQKYMAIYQHMHEKFSKYDRNLRMKRKAEGQDITSLDLLYANLDGSVGI